MAKKKKVHCENCNFPADSVRQRGDKPPLCDICAESMPGLYVVGSTARSEIGSVSVPAVIMRQNAYCTNAILHKLKEMHGGKA